MSEIENNNKQIHYVYPSNMQTAYEDDEINLVDLWITLKSYKKQFIVYFVISSLVLFLMVSFLYKSQYEITSSFQIGTVETGGSIRPIDSLEATKNKLDDVLIPQSMLNVLSDNDNFDEFKTTVKTSKGSDVILLKNKAVEADFAVYKSFQSNVLSLLLEDHVNKVSITQTNLKRSLKDAEFALSLLQDPQTLDILLKEKDLVITNNDALLKQLQNNYDLLKKNDYNSVLSFVSSVELEKFVTTDGKVLDELVKVRYEVLLLENLSAQQKLISEIEQLKLNKIKIAKTHEEKIKKQFLIIEEIKLQITDVNHSAVLSQSVVSNEHVGISQKMIGVLIVFVSGFIAFIGMLLAMFKDKVAQRIAEKA